ncbi:MAG: peptidase, partial [Bacteroidota bacterium]
GQGGINFNQNLTFNFKHFAAGAGEFPVSEVETRAVVDYLFDRWNVFAVLTYGPSDNLAAPLKYSRNNQKGNIITGILQGDAKINAVVAGDFKKTMKLPKSAKQNLTAGGFMEWAHFHYGRYSFGTPGWYVPDWKMPKDSVERLAFKEVKDGNADINFLRWAADQGMQNFFVNWTKVDHPDFPDHEVEVGGIAPYVMLNPPYNMVKNQVEPHLNFVKKLLGYRPQVKLVNTKVEKVSNDLWRVKASVMNDGFFATASDMGNRFNFVKRVKATMELNDGQQFLSGQKVQLFGAMKGGTSNELEWLINGNGTVTLTVGAPQCGVERMELELK